MSIQSMTGFGKGEAEGKLYTLSVEIKSVNHRFKDFRFKMPNLFNSIEVELKNDLSNHFKRGSIDIFVNYKKNDKSNDFDDLDLEKINNFLKTFGQKIEEFNFSPTNFLRNEFQKDIEDEKSEELLSLLKEAFPIAIENLKKSRTDEGAKLEKILKENLELYEKYSSDTGKHKLQYQEKVKEKILKRFSEFTEVKVDETRFLQEVVYYLEKLDIEEELDRIKAHIEKFQKVLKKEKEIGREIDFLVQELNRETNTIGSKSGLEEISENVIQMKVCLERIREQALNIE